MTTFPKVKHTAAAAAKSLQSCPTLCDPRDGSPPTAKAILNTDRPPCSTSTGISGGNFCFASCFHEHTCFLPYYDPVHCLNCEPPSDCTREPRGFYSIRDLHEMCSGLRPSQVAGPKFSLAVHPQAGPFCPTYGRWCLHSISPS